MLSHCRSVIVQDGGKVAKQMQWSARLWVHAVFYFVSHGHIHLVMKVTPPTVRHRKALPLRMPYCEQFRLIRFADPLVSAGMVATSPTAIVPIGYVIGRLTCVAPVLCVLPMFCRPRLSGAMRFLNLLCICVLMALLAVVVS